MKRTFKNNFIVLLFLASAVLVLVLSIYSNTLRASALEILEYNTQQRLLALAKSAAKLVTADELEQLQTPEDMEKPLYMEIKQRLHEFTVDSNIMFTYYLRPNQDGMLQFVVDSDFDPETMVGLASEAVAPEPAPLDALGGQAASAGIGNYSQNWEGILAAYAPVYDSNGNVYCIAGVDMSDEQIVLYNSQMTALSIIQAISMIVAIFSGFAGLVMYRNRARVSEESNRAKSEFLSRMSHEIRTPMNAILGLVRMARETRDVDTIYTYLDDISSSSGHLLMLINDILDISKIESGKMILEVLPVDIHAEIESVCHIIQPQADAKNQRFVVEVAPSLPPYLYCDNTHIRQILVNLLSNAVKFTREGGEVSLTVNVCGVDGDKVLVQWCVKDNGIGISEKSVARIFESFEQGDGSTTRQFGGTGLGLAITKQLVDMMNGTIDVRSKFGRGSEFIFDVWLKKATHAGGRTNIVPEGGDAGEESLAGKTLLLVEDNDINSMIAEHVFKSMGAQVECAKNGQEGYDLFVADPGKYDIIFMDIQMPVMDGYEAAEKIRASGLPGADSVPIIAMTANVFKEDVQHVLDAGMDAHIGKPFEIEQVEQAVREVMRKKRSDAD